MTGVQTCPLPISGSWSLAAIHCDSAGAVVDLAKGSVTITPVVGDQITCTFNTQHRSSLRVRAYHDRNGDGQRHDEPRLKGWKMMLYDAAGKKLATETTDSNGTARFYRLRPGAYTVCEEVRKGWFNSQPGAILAAFGNQPCYAITVAPAQKWTAWFGNHQDATLVKAASVDALTVANGMNELLILDDIDDAGYEIDVSAIDEELLIQRFYLPVLINN